MTRLRALLSRLTPPSPLSLIGLGLLTAAAWTVSLTLGLAAAGVALIVYELGVGD